MNTADYQSHPYPEGLTQCCRHFLHLLSQLTSRTQHDRLDRDTLRIELPDDGAGEGQRLAGSSLRLADQVDALHGDRDGQLLDRSGVKEPESGQLVQNRARQR